MFLFSEVNMTRKCELTGKLVISGNNVSHANNKTKRKFLPNLQNVSLYSEALNKKVKLRIAASSLRTVEKSGGIDNYLLKTNALKLSNQARKFKKNILKKTESKD